jgi:hypothetical protein
MVEREIDCNLLGDRPVAFYDGPRLKLSIGARP